MGGVAILIHQRIKIATPSFTEARGDRIPILQNPYDYNIFRGVLHPTRLVYRCSIIDTKVLHYAKQISLTAHSSSEISGMLPQLPARLGSVTTLGAYFLAPSVRSGWVSCLEEIDAV